MAIAPTGAIYKALTFDGISSRTYGVYITGKAVYNAPERNVEMITIPGRNGAFALDHGRFENIEVTYPAGIFADTETDFVQAISDFRNYLCSRDGYVRLTDEYNPNEYRMAVYKSGLEVTPAMLKAGKFDITFQCMPQRWLTSGESAISVTDGDTVTNPTLFDASPMLEIEGYGAITIGDKTISVDDGEFGVIQISDATGSYMTSLDVSNLNTGDRIYKLDSTKPTLVLGMRGTSALTVNVTSITNGTYYINRLTAGETQLTVIPELTQFLKGTSATITTTLSLSINVGGTTYTCTFYVYTAYSGTNSTITISSLRSGTWPASVTVLRYSTSHSLPAFYGDSTVTLRPTPLYIDLDIGEAYGDVNGVTTSMNNIVSLSAKLPVLKAGANIVSFDNTITDLKIIPRWWKL